MLPTVSDGRRAVGGYLELHLPPVLTDGLPWYRIQSLCHARDDIFMGTWYLSVRGGQAGHSYSVSAVSALVAQGGGQA